jgi:pimeloyl-ACP methyl ester carboxylesterase
MAAPTLASSPPLVALFDSPPRHSLRGALTVAAATLGWSRPRGHGVDLSAVNHVTLAHAGTGPLHVLASAARRPAVRSARLVLVHGTPGTAAGWGEWLADPPAGFEVLAPDRPGFGASGPTHALTSLTAQADAVAALLPDDGCPNVLLGHSLGGAVAACTAARHGRRVHALVLLAAALDPALEQVHPLQRLGRLAGVRALLPRAIRNANDELLALQRELSTLAPQLALVRCPVFIVHGTHDRLVPVANVRYLHQRLDGAAAVVTELLRGRDHFLPWNAAHEVRRVVAAAAAAAC